MTRQNLFGQWRFRYFDINGRKVCHAEVLPVESFGEVVDVVDEESPAVDDDRFADAEVDWSEILLHFLVCDLHRSKWKVRLNVITVLWTPVSTHEHRERVLTVVIEAHLYKLHRVVTQVVLKDTQHTRRKHRLNGQFTTHLPLTVHSFTRERSHFYSRDLNMQGSQSSTANSATSTRQGVTL